MWLTLYVHAHLCAAMHTQTARLCLGKCLMHADSIYCNYSVQYALWHCGVFAFVLVRPLVVLVSALCVIQCIYCSHPDLHYGNPQRRQAGVKHTVPGGGGSGGEEVDFISD